jgi:hypothetical protein
LNVARASAAEAQCGQLPALLLGGGQPHPALPQGPLRRMAAGLRTLGVVAEVATGALLPGPWCATAPLWGNPLLQLELRGDQRTVQWGVGASAAVAAAAPPAAVAAPPHEWGEGFSCLVGCPGLHTVRDLVVLRRSLDRAEVAARVPGVRPGALLRATFGCEGVQLPPLLACLFSYWAPGGVGIAGVLHRVVEAAYTALPSAWVAAVVAGVAPLPLTLGHEQRLDVAAVQATVGLVCGRLGWGRISLRPAPADARLVAMSVKAATTLQLGPRLAAQRRARSEYAACALAAAVQPAVLEQAVDQLEAAMRDLWRVEWDNSRREILWRLSVNGVRGAGGHSIASTHPCVCGCAAPPAGSARVVASHAWRLHHFWGCPVATAVVAELQSALPAGCAPLTRAHLWLLRAPPGVHPGVWGVVCAAALEAMERGRCALWRARESEVRLATSQKRITDYFPRLGAPAGGAPLTAVQRAQRVAAAWLWCLLQDFVSLHDCAGGSVLLGRWPGLAAAHPFVFFAAGGLLRLRLPPRLALPAAL